MRPPIRTPGCERVAPRRPGMLAACQAISSQLGLAVLVASALLLGGCARIAGVWQLAPFPGASPRSAPPPTIVLAQPTGPGDIRGRLLAVPPRPGEPTSVVIYADPIDASGKAKIPPRAATIRRIGESFSPSFAVVSIDQTIHFRDDGDLFHRIFSYSEPNAFDLGVVGGGESKSVVFHHPGLVRFYCSLHGWESGVIFVAPSPYFDTVRPSGEYELVDVPPGRYRLETWSESLSGSSLDVTVRPGRSTSVELSVWPIREID
jgi:plastocyanin